ncbi:hypothetical protein KP509_02G105600 [Ceratopteris richardii]|uniref:Protein PEP-RELATED DEVELOPMENT ARRESTED 1, chloroplastic n=1 Tax=Ceratopteris richardii TaxID=49495 RepID=A0A8T2VKU7_CERRI|nr:hypothetical protein KP509_02G105600 [Ceratopteris richardii]
MASLRLQLSASSSYAAVRAEFPALRKSSLAFMPTFARGNLCVACSITIPRSTQATVASVQSGSPMTHNMEEETWNAETYAALLRGGEDVADVMKTMTEVLSDVEGLDQDKEGLAIHLAAAGAIQQKLDSLDGSFLLALDWMIREAEVENDDERKEVLEIIKETVLGQLNEKCPPHVQVLGLLCRTPTKEKRTEILRRSAGGGGVFDTESGGKLTIPFSNLMNISTQADNLVSSMEEKPRIKDRRLLAKLVVIRDEARSMLGGGLLDERNDNRGFKNLPSNVVKFLSSIVSVRPGPSLRQKLLNVMNGKDEGQDPPEETDNDDVEGQNRAEKSKVSSKSDHELPVRPGMFLEAVMKVFYLFLILISISGNNPR